MTRRRMITGFVIDHPITVFLLAVAVFAICFVLFRFLRAVAIVLEVWNPDV